MPSSRISALYGSWKSPITAARVASSSNAYFETKLTEDGTVFFIERRPQEQGRHVILRVKGDGQVEEVIPPGFNARTRVHEYGGASYLVTKDSVFFSNFGDLLVYKLDLSKSASPVPITSNSQTYYADFIFDERRRRLISVREDHAVSGEAVNTIASLDPNGKDGVTVLISGNDFYSSPRLSPDGSKLAWLTWNHPSLPFFGSELWVGDISNGGAIVNRRKVAGGIEESIAEPRWSPDGVLYFVSDRSNWWNIHRFDNNTVENVYPANFEFAGAHWVFGLSSYAFIPKSEILCSFVKDGFCRLAVLDVRSKLFREVANPFTEVSYVESNTHNVIMIAGSSSSPDAIVLFDPSNSKFTTIYPKTGGEKLDSSYLSLPTSIEYPTEGNKTAYALYYSPKNGDYEASDSSLPPLIVISHGGPTSRCRSDLNLGIQFWTSRGFAVADVNYGGSTGYGREYRIRLDGTWGVVDVDDCMNAAMFLARENKVDKTRLIIRGGSAGGYTTLSALAFRKAFMAGASYYGISDLEIFAKDTHKFESRYLDMLVGPFPEKRELYRERSAINYLDEISAPVIFFQGLEDMVVPPNQAEMMFDALRNKGLPTAYIAFEGEQHGFRQAKNIIRSYEAELYFYSRVFNFDLPEIIEPVKIENLPRSS